MFVRVSETDLRTAAKPSSLVVYHLKYAMIFALGAQGLCAEFVTDDIQNQ